MVLDDINKLASISLVNIDEDMNVASTSKGDNVIAFR